jgi:imidazolonepropionase-like amidohydrolase
MLSEARRRGVRVAVGTDTNHGDIAAEAQALIDAGFTAGQALAAVTIEGARLTRTDGIIGAIQVGKQADLVALEANPLLSATAYKTVRHVFQKGVPANT